MAQSSLDIVTFLPLDMGTLLNETRGDRLLQIPLPASNITLALGASFVPPAAEALAAYQDREESLNLTSLCP